MRVLYCTLAGAAFGLLAVVIYVAVEGYLLGGGANHQHPPGLGSAALNVVIGVVFLGPAAVACGALAGCCVGLVGQVVRKARGPRPPHFSA